MTTAIAPPGQLSLWWPAPTARAPKSLRILTAAAVTTAIRDLPLAAIRAAAVAEQLGDAWLVADDLTCAHVSPAGDVTPTTGWAASAARVLTNRRKP